MRFLILRVPTVSRSSASSSSHGICLRAIFNGISGCCSIQSYLYILNLKALFHASKSPEKPGAKKAKNGVSTIRIKLYSTINSVKPVLSKKIIKHFLRHLRKFDSSLLRIGKNHSNDSWMIMNIHITDIPRKKPKKFFNAK